MTALIGSIQHAADTEANWIANNPVLLANQLYISTDVFYTGTNCPKIKIGKGAAWNETQYIHTAYTPSVQKFSPNVLVPADTEYVIVLSNPTKTIPRVLIDGVSLTIVDTIQPGVEGFSHTTGTDEIVVRVPYTIDTNETISIFYEY